MAFTAKQIKRYLDLKARALRGEGNESAVAWKLLAKLAAEFPGLAAAAEASKAEPKSGSSWADNVNWSELAAQAVRVVDAVSNAVGEMEREAGPRALIRWAHSISIKRRFVRGVDAKVTVTISARQAEELVRLLQEESEYEIAIDELMHRIRETIKQGIERL